MWEHQSSAHQRYSMLHSRHMPMLSFWGSADKPNETNGLSSFVKEMWHKL